MNRRVTILPVEGRRVRLPDGRVLGAAGVRIVPSSYWLRLLRAGDVIFSKGRKPAKAASGNEEQP